MHGKSAALKSFLLALFCVTALTFWATGSNLAAAQDLSRKINALASLPDLHAADTDAIFATVGFAPHMSNEDWRSLSFAEQLEIAYRAAEASPLPQGDRLLTEVATLISNDYDSIKYDPNFLDVFHPANRAGQTLFLHTITFGEPTAAEQERPLPDAVKVKVDALSVYVEGTGEFGRVTVLKRIFDLQSPALERALRNRNTREMLLSATSLAALPPPAEERVNALAVEVGTHFDSSALSPTLRQIVVEALLERWAKTLDPDVFRAWRRFETTPGSTPSEKRSDPLEEWREWRRQESRRFETTPGSMVFRPEPRNDDVRKLREKGSDRWDESIPQQRSRAEQIGHGETRKNRPPERRPGVP